MARKSSKNLLFTGMDIPKALQNVVDQMIEKMEKENGEKAPQAYLDIVESIIGTLKSMLEYTIEDSNSIIVHCPNLDIPEELDYNELVKLFPEVASFDEE